MPNYVYPAIALIGGGTGALDAIDGTALADKDMAMVSVQGDKTYFYVLNATSGAAEASPGIIAPDANGGDKRWILTGFTPVPAATGFTIAGGTTSKTLTVSSDADTKDIIKGDGTAGRVLRRSYIRIRNGTSAATINPSMTNVWNGDANGEEDNLGKGGSGTVFSLNAGGTTLTVDGVGITGNPITILSCEISVNGTGTALIVDAYQLASSLVFAFTNANGAAIDLTTLVDTGDIYCVFTYITSA